MKLALLLLLLCRKNESFIHQCCMSTKSTSFLKPKFIATCKLAATMQVSTLHNLQQMSHVKLHKKWDLFATPDNCILMAAIQFTKNLKIQQKQSCPNWVILYFIPEAKRINTSTCSPGTRLKLCGADVPAKMPLCSRKRANLLICIYRWIRLYLRLVWNVTLSKKNWRCAYIKAADLNIFHIVTHITTGQSCRNLLWSSHKSRETESQPLGNSTSTEDHRLPEAHQTWPPLRVLASHRRENQMKAFALVFRILRSPGLGHLWDPSPPLQVHCLKFTSETALGSAQACA